MGNESKDRDIAIGLIKEWVNDDLITIDDLRSLTGDMYELEQRADALTEGMENVF